MFRNPSRAAVPPVPRPGFRAARRGVAALEFALIAPVLLALATASVGLCLMIRAQTDLAQAAQTMAQLIAAQSTVAPGQIADFCTGARDEMAPYSTATLTISVASVTRSTASDTAGIDWQNTSCGNGTAISGPTTLAAAVIPAAGDSTIVVQALDVFANPLSLLLPASFPLSAVAFARPRGNTTVGYN